MTDQSHEVNPYAAPEAAGTFDPIAAFGSHEALRQTALGLNLVFWGLVIVLGSIIFGVVALIASGAAAIGGGGSEAVGGFAAGAIVLLGGVIVGTVVGLVGRFLCLSVPEATGAKGFIYGAVGCDIAALAFSLTPLVYEAAAGYESASNILSLIGAILFVMFMKRVAGFIRRPDLAARAQSLITLGVTVFVLALLTAVLGMIIGPLVLVLMLAVIGIGIFMFFRYVALLRGLRAAILAGTD